MAGYSAWLHVLAERGGKGVVDNIDARSLGQAAKEIDALEARVKELEDWLDACLGLVNGYGPPNWDGIREVLKQQYSQYPDPGFR